MSETFRVGDLGLLKDINDEIRYEFGVLEVVASDLFTIRVVPVDGSDGWIAFNAGTLRIKSNESSACVPMGVRFVRLTQEHADHIAGQQRRRERTELNKKQVSDLACQTCAWWRPPFTVGPGNCHNPNLIALTRANDDGFPPPTPATFGCVHWETKENQAEEIEAHD